MQRTKLIVLLLVTLVYVTAIEIDDDDITIMEDTSNDIVSDFDKEEIAKSFRKSRILWPYPYNSKNEKNQNQDDISNSSDNKNDEKAENKRGPRFFHWSYPQSHIVDMMMQTMAANYAPLHSNDPFDFLRDSYSLPKGNISMFVTCIFNYSWFSYS